MENPFHVPVILAVVNEFTIKYKIDDKPNFQTPNKTAGEIWERDKKKLDYLESLGYHVLVIWESEYLSNKDQILNKCYDFINHYLEENNETL